MTRILASRATSISSMPTRTPGITRSSVRTCGGSAQGSGCSHIKIGDGDWLDCETVGEGIFDQLGLCTDKKEIRGRFQVEDFHDETKFTEEEGSLTFSEARSSAIEGRLRAKARAEQEAWPPELKRKLGLEP